MVLYAAYHGLRILRGWDLESGSEAQLALERKTYLISTLLAYALGFQLLSLFLFVFTADQIHLLFVGAMCASGSLNVNPYGYPALLLKLLTFLMAGLWLLVNHVDNRAWDYPLIKVKYGLLLGMVPFLVGEAVLQWNYFLRLRPDVITSCCGTLFSTEVATLSAEMASLPRVPMMVLFYGVLLLTLGAGAYFYRQGRYGYGFGLLCGFTLVVSILAIISFISLYYYELPTHHCPFCILQKEYGYVGYPLYGALFGGGILGMGVGCIMPFRRMKSLEETLPRFQKKLALGSILLLGLFGVLVTFRMISSTLVF